MLHSLPLLSCEVQSRVYCLVGRRLLWMWFGVVQMVGSGTLFAMKLALKLVYIHSKATIHRHPHCTCVTQRAPNTGTSTYARKSWGGLPRCDLAPQSTSFGTVALRERQHLAMTATCPEGEAWAASRNWNHGTHFLWDPRAAPTFHPLSTLRHRVQRSTFHLQLSTIVQSAGCGRVKARGYAGRMSGMQWYDGWLHPPAFRAYGTCSFGLR